MLGVDANGTHTVQFSQQDLTQLANIGNGSISFGPLTLSWNFSLNPLQATFNATLLGISLGSVTLDPSNPNVTLGGSAGPFTAEVSLSLNVATMTISYHVVVKTFITIIDKSGTISL